MKKTIKLLICSVLMIAMLAGCGAEEFSYSNFLDENGYFKGVTASDYVELPNYENMPFDKSFIEVTDEELQVQIDSILEGAATVEQITDRAVEDGDTINIVYEGKIDGVAFDGGSTGEAGTEVTIGETQYIDDFLEQVIGHMPGETFDVEVTFPEGYQEDSLSGKDAVFTCTVSYIYGETILPELTDEIASEYGFATVSELKEDINSWMLKQKRNQIVSTILDLATVSEIPDIVMDHAIGEELERCSDYAAMYGMSVDQYYQAVGFENEKKYIEGNMTTFENNSSTYLAIQAFAEAEGIVATMEDVENYGYAEYVETLGEEYVKLVVMQNELVPERIVSKLNFTESAE